MERILILATLCILAVCGEWSYGHSPPVAELLGSSQFLYRPALAERRSRQGGIPQRRTVLVDSESRGPLYRSSTNKGEGNLNLINQPIVLLRAQVDEGFRNLEERLDRIEMTLGDIEKEITQELSSLKQRKTALSSDYEPDDDDYAMLFQAVPVAINKDGENDAKLTQNTRRVTAANTLQEDDSEEDNCDDDQSCEADDSSESPVVRSSGPVSRKVFNFDDGDETKPRQENTFPSGRKLLPDIYQHGAEPTTSAIAEISAVCKEMEAEETKKALSKRKSFAPEEFRIDAETLPMMS